MNAVWSCKIGYADRERLPKHSDAPMREMVGDAFEALTGEQAEFIFSGWGARLTEGELAVVEDREPVRELTEFGQAEIAADTIERQGDLLYTAWTIIANANEGDWSKATDEWRGAAERWRDQFHEQLSAASDSSPSGANPADHSRAIGPESSPT